MASTDTPVSRDRLSPVGSILTRTEAPGELNARSYSQNQALVPAPLFADRPQALATKRAKTVPPKRKSGESPPMLERAYTVNAAARDANDLAVDVSRHSRNLIDDFLKGLVNGPPTPRNLIDDFLNGLAQGGTPKRRVRKPAVESRVILDISPVDGPCVDLPLSQNFTTSVSVAHNETHEHLPVEVPVEVTVEATVLAEIEELSSTLDGCHHPDPEPRIPNNIPRRRQACGDLREEYKRDCLESISDKVLFAEKPSHYRTRPTLSINTNFETPSHFTAPERAERPSQPRAQRPRLSLDTNVSACSSDSSLELEVGQHVKVFYMGLMNGEIDAAAYMEVDLDSSFSDEQRTNHHPDTSELEGSSSAVSKTSLESAYEKHEAASYAGLVDGDDDSETSSKCPESVKAMSIFLESPVSPLSATGLVVRSGAPSSTSSVGESTDVARHWDQQKAQSRLERRAPSRQSSVPTSPFFHAAL